MYIEEPKKTVNGKIYKSRLLRESYRDSNGKVQKRTILNLNKLPDKIADTIVLMVKSGLEININDTSVFSHTQGKSIGAIKVISEIAKTLGITKALGSSKESKLVLLLLAGIILSPKKSKSYIANSWSKYQAIEEIFKIKPNFNENDLYKALTFLEMKQESIENKLSLSLSKVTKKSNNLFLYDVTSSYVEGDQIAFSTYGYNRDKKKGKKQIVIGLLTDETGMPVSVEVFDGNTHDNATVSNQLEKIKERFNAEKIIFVGDRGMIKSAQVEEIKDKKWNYITGITRPQIESLLNNNIIQLEIFDTDIKEIEYNGIRYILRRNPIRKEEIMNNLHVRIKRLFDEVAKKNTYLAEHGKAKTEVAIKNLLSLQTKLNLVKFTDISIENRTVSIVKNEDAIADKESLAGCYVLKTNLKCDELSKEDVHARYKDLYSVEEDFKNLKTEFLNIRPIHVRTKSHVKAHVFACTLALMIIRYVESKLKSTGISKHETWECLEKIQYQNIICNGVSFKSIPSKLQPVQQQILDKLEIVLPKTV